LFIGANKKNITVFSKKMAYYDEGEGDPIIFLHGNPSSSYLWRNIAPNFFQSNRVIVPDLIGMGDSEKLDGVNNKDYNFSGHYKFLCEFLLSISIKKNIHLVIHDCS
tara:strand:- start:12 stop:332 length:321 start_codon:yes stop_codon:yes gene_type:complete